MPQFTSPRPSVSLSLRKPRNPLVGPALLRQAGRHGGGVKSGRQRAARSLQQELQQMSDRSP